MSAATRAGSDGSGAAVDLPGAVRAALRIEAADPVWAGGSPARVWRVRTADGRSLVVKALTDRDGIVDGHDLGSFVRKPRQIAAVHRCLPLLSPFYAEVVGEWRGPGWAAYAMPYYQGDDVTAPLRRAEPDLTGFRRDLDRVFRTLTEYGYAVQTRPAPPDHFRRTHLDRVARRLPLLRRCLQPDLFSADSVLVNGQRCLTLPRLLDRLSADERTHAALQPARLHFPVHGDLNLGNLLLRRRAGEPGFVVLDPRGTLRFWDPVYDFAKALFSLTVFEPLLASGCTVRRLRDRGPGAVGATPSYQVAHVDGHPGHLAAALDLLPLLERLPFGAELDRTDPGWRRRLLYTHAVHCLAEAACRLSDRKPRSYPGAYGWDACVLLATGLHLIGLRLINDLARTRDPIAAPDHLGWLAAERTGPSSSGPAAERTPGDHDGPA